jgi:1L-myo-inositol 1-phosphate cytidylyltransferase
LIDLALILAAGKGSRLEGYHSVPHKALIPVGGQPLLVRTCRMLQDLGLRQVTVVTGYQGEAIRLALKAAADLRVELDFVENPQWRKANGLSVLAAADRLRRDYLLLMADHLFAPEIAAGLLGVELGAEEVVLAVDRKIDAIYDLEDATKVRLEGERIAAIGKEIERFDAIDTGLFACSGALVGALRRQAETAGDCSLSDGMRRLAQAGHLRYRDIGAAWWQDIDTPGALQAARLLAGETPA